VNDLITQTAQKYIEQVQDVNEDLGRFDLLDSQGRPLNLNQHKGKIVIIEFWATWCSPCLKSMEHTHELQQAFPGQIVVIAVSGDPEERHMKAKEYLSEKGYNFILAFDDEKKRDVMLPYIPARLIMDRQGRLRVLEFGYTKETVYLFEKKLADLLAKKRDLD
jgi:thiol-disulfide isomerase/thioredoxin